jgi:trigger factor
MQTEIRALNDVDYALDIHIPADAFQPEIESALKKQRATMTLKGFRQGKVPPALVRKMVGPQVTLDVAERLIGEAYRTAVVEPDELDVLGNPRLDDLTLDPADATADLRAVVLFGIRPTIELADTSAMPVTRIVKSFTDEDVDADLQRRRDLAATEEDAPEGTVLAADHVAKVDIQPVSADGEPNGPVQHDARLVMANPDLRKEMKDALLGLSAGDTVTVELPHQHGPDEGHDHEDHVDRYKVTLQTIQVRTLPEVDATFISAQTNGRTEDLDEFKTQILEDLDRSWTQRSRQAQESKMAELFAEAHRETVAVPATIVDAALESMLDQLRERNKGALPPTFDVQAYFDQNRAQAEIEMRWLLVKDALIREEGIEVTEDDFEAEFARMAGPDGDTAMIKGFFMQQEQLIEQMGNHLLSQRVFDALERRFTVVEKTPEDIKAEADARAAEAV